MAEFDAVLRKMSEADIRETAAELLARLYPGKKSANRGEADNYESFEASAFPEKAAEEHAAFSRLEHIDPERIRERRSFEAEEEHMPMSTSENLSEGAEIIGRNEYEPMYAPMRLSRETDYAGVDTEPYAAILSHESVGEGNAAPGARELSEFFRRDSRRYDKEFERY